MNTAAVVLAAFAGWFAAAFLLAILAGKRLAAGHTEEWLAAEQRARDVWFDEQQRTR